MGSATSTDGYAASPLPRRRTILTVLLRNWLSANGYLRTASTIEATAAAAIAAPTATWSERERRNRPSPFRREAVLLGGVNARVDRSAELAEGDAQGRGDAAHGRPRGVHRSALDPRVSRDGQPSLVREILLRVAALCAQCEERFGERGVWGGWSRHASADIARYRESQPGS
jgi:hypothetical protein